MLTPNTVSIETEKIVLNSKIIWRRSQISLNFEVGSMVRLNFLSHSNSNIVHPDILYINLLIKEKKETTILDYYLFYER